MFITKGLKNFKTLVEKEVTVKKFLQMERILQFRLITVQLVVLPLRKNNKYRLTFIPITSITVIFVKIFSHSKKVKAHGKSFNRLMF